MLAWTRTGLAVMAFACVLGRPGLGPGPADGTRCTAAAFALLGAAINVYGIVRFARVERALLARRQIPTGGLQAALAAALLTVGGLAMLLYLLASR